MYVSPQVQAVSLSPEDITTKLSLHRKFGKQIQKRQLEVPEYAASFVNYKALKKVRLNYCLIRSALSYKLRASDTCGSLMKKFSPFTNTTIAHQEALRYSYNSCAE